MKPYLKLVLGMVGLVEITGGLLAADVATTYNSTNTTYTTNPNGLLNYAGTPVANSASNAVMVALNAQVLLLKELVQEHQKRAADLAQKNQGEMAKWETELVNELQEKSARVQKSIDQAPSWTGTNASKARSGEADDELIFVSRVEERLEQLNQELVSVAEQSMALAMQMATNKSPDSIPAMSFAAEENQRVMKQLQREQLDLELRKLEFRAIRRATQK
jgi:predicted nuclease with TOPRIM domain